jgi:hypothetical protein
MSYPEMLFLSDFEKQQQYDRKRFKIYKKYRIKATIPIIMKKRKTKSKIAILILYPEIK